jgi:hypothetical protein
MPFITLTNNNQLVVELKTKIMKTILTVLLLAFCTTLFSQTQEQMIRRYERYKGNLLVTRKPLSFNEWLKTQGIDSLKYENIKLPDSKNIPPDEITSKLVKNYSPGSLLIKAKNQIYAGIGLQFTGSTIIIMDEIVRLNKIRSGETNVGDGMPALIVGGVLGLAGFAFELSGFNNIGKAGISFNKNGIGVNINF